MDVRYNRSRLITMAVALAFFASVTVLGLQETARTGPDSDGFEILGIVVAALLLGLSARMAILVVRRDNRVLTIEPSGVTFHQPPLGAIGWDRIADIVHRRNALQKSLGFRFHEPLPALPAWTRVQYHLNRLVTPNAPHLHLPIHLIENSTDEILECLARSRRSGRG